MESKNKFNYISLFSGAGIGCFNLKDLNFECLASVEINQKRLNIQRINQKCTNEKSYICEDLSLDSTKENIKHILTENLQTNSLNLLIATPPCQGMSVANHKKKNELARNSLVVDSIKLTKDFKPQFFIYENVATFLNTYCFDGVKELKIQDCINEYLQNDYFIFAKVVNFKNYGANSSRTRTLVIGVKKELQISPLEIFPCFTHEKTIREIIGNFKSLKVMGEIDSNDIFHQFRNYDTKMLDWIKDIKEGQSAFDNIDITKRPHKIQDGKIIENTNKNGDKYKRQYWDKVAPCIHTRNDILASQNTIHPSDNRVFSIREVMEFMNVPKSFKWSGIELNSLDLKDKQKFLKNNELFIRRCLGEAVPSIIFENIAKNITTQRNKKRLNKKEILESSKHVDVLNFTKTNKEKLDFDSIAQVVQMSKANQKEYASYFTSQMTCWEMIKDLPDFKNKEKLSILEPSCGVGSFLPQILKKYQDKFLEIDCIDLDLENINFVKEYFKDTERVKFNFLHTDFLDFNPTKKYDLIIGNPPFGNIIKDKKKLKLYKEKLNIQKTNNIFAFFIKKALGIADFLYFITPKSLLNAPEFEDLRQEIQSKKILKISDYGESAFDIKIETISFLIENKNINNTKVMIYKEDKQEFKNQKYITQNPFGVWLLYRDDFFDSIMDKMQFGIFKVFRDRQITKQILQDNGKIRVLKSRNIINNGILNIKNYDKFIDDANNLVVAKFLNSDKQIVLVPNLTYYPRATFLPKNSIADGSVAILTTDVEIKQSDLEYFGSDEFYRFYKIARNYATRTLNIDSNSVKFFAIQRINNEF